MRIEDLNVKIHLEGTKQIHCYWYYFWVEFYQYEFQKNYDEFTHTFFETKNCNFCVNSNGYKMLKIDGIELFGHLKIKKYLNDNTRTKY